MILFHVAGKYRWRLTITIDGDSVTWADVSKLALKYDGDWPIMSLRYTKEYDIFEDEDL